MCCSAPGPRSTPSPHPSRCVGRYVQARFLGLCVGPTIANVGPQPPNSGSHRNTKHISIHRRGTDSDAHKTQRYTAILLCAAQIQTSNGRKPHARTFCSNFRAGQWEFEESATSHPACKTLKHSRRLCTHTHTHTLTMRGNDRTYTPEVRRTP